MKTRLPWERTPLRPANKVEVAYVLKLASYADGIQTDGVAFYWSEPGTMAQFSTQYRPDGA